MSVLRTGSSKKFAEGWELAFGKKAKTPNRRKVATKKNPNRADENGRRRDIKQKTFRNAELGVIRL